MLISKLRGIFAAALLSGAAAIAVQPVIAADASVTRSANEPIAAFRKGVAAYKARDAKTAVEAFELASKEGILGAELYLARMYSRGELVAQDDSKAFEQYMRIVRGFADLDAEHAGAKFVAEAFVAVGRYYERGLPDRGITRNVSKAARFYGHAASYFRDPAAQFKLARLYLKDNGLARNIPVAAKWLHSAAKKNHAPSQALLAELLWAGGPVEKRDVQALALIDLALMNAKGPEKDWISELHKKIFDAAKVADKKKAKLILAQWQSRISGNKSVKVAQEPKQAKPAAKDDELKETASVTFHPDAVSVILGTPGGSDDFDADALFGAATQINIPDVDGGYIQAGTEQSGM